MVLMNAIGVENTRYGVEVGVGVENVCLSRPINQRLGALHSHGLQNPNNENNQSLVALDSKPIARLFFIIFFTVFHGFSLSKMVLMVWDKGWKIGVEKLDFIAITRYNKSRTIINFVLLRRRANGKKSKRRRKLELP